MPVSIKICGLSTPETLEAAIDAQADYCGFVAFPPSPRHLDPSTFAQLSRAARGRIERVGLFVNPDDMMISTFLQAGDLDAIQLHGDETPQRVAEVKERFGLPVWKAVPVAGAEDIGRAESYDAVADLILFDAKTPEDASRPGGMGLRFDWSLVASFRGRCEWGLAGGLTPENVTEAIAQTGARLVDTSSGVESAPGVKDVDRIAAFCKAARQI